MLTVFASVILCTQLLAAIPAGQPAGLLWTDEEVAQGFAWDEAVAASGVPDHDGDCLVSVDTRPDARFALAEDALWAVSVPFMAVEASVDVGTVLGESRLPIGPGRHQLFFQPGRAARSTPSD